MDTPTLVPADTAWMLVSTALVLLMTPALAFFYGGLVRSKNALNTMMMSVAALGFVGVAWAVLGYSLAFAGGGAFVGDLSKAFLAGVGLEPQGTIPHLLFMAYQGTFAIITAALDLGRDRRADALRGRTSPSSPSGASSSTPRSRTGCGAAASSRRWGRSTSRAAPSCTSTRPPPPWWPRVVHRPAEGLRPAGHPAPQRALHPPRGGAAVVRLVRLQRAAAPSRPTASPPSRSSTRCSRPPARWSSGRCSTSCATARPPRSAPRPASWSGLVAITPAAGFVGPMPALVLGDDRRLPELLRARVPRAHAARRLARRGRGARPGRHGGGAADRRLRLEDLERHRSTGSSTATPASWASRRSASSRRSPTAGSRATCCSSSSALVTPLKVRHARGGPRARREPARRGGLRRRRRRDPRSCSGRRAPRRPVSPRSPPRRRKEVAREARGGDRPAGEGQRGARGALPGRRPGPHPHPRAGPRGRDRAGRDLPRDHGEDGALGEGAARHRRLRPLRGADGEGDPRRRPHGRRRGRQGLRPAGREDLPHPHRRGGPRGGHPGAGGGGGEG